MHTEETTKLLEATCAPSACVIDFFEARDRLQQGLDERGQPPGTKGKPQKLALLRSIKRTDLFEESIYWVLSAVVLVYLLLEIICQ
jgi:hypothetical protein